MKREEITAQIVSARLAKGLTWQQLADAIGKPVVWTTAALLGQHPIPAQLAKVVVEMLGLDESAVPVLAAVPMRGGLPTAVPTDPTIYRFYEVLQVYGGAPVRRPCCRHPRRQVPALRLDGGRELTLAYRVRRLRVEPSDTHERFSSESERRSR